MKRSGDRFHFQKGENEEMSRKKIIAGNWKMNIKPSETAALVKGVAEATKIGRASCRERV